MLFFYNNIRYVAGYLLKYRDENGRLVETLIDETSVTITDLQPSTTYTDITLQTMINGTLSDPLVFPSQVSTGNKFNC